MNLLHNPSHKKFTPFKKKFIFKIFIVLLLFFFVFFGALFYVKQAINNWGEDHKLSITMRSVSFSWYQWGMPGIAFKEVTIKNKDPQGTFEKVYADKILIQPYFLNFFQNYIKNYKISINVKNVKVFLSEKILLESSLLSSDITHIHDIYKISNFNIEPFYIKMASENDSELKTQKIENIHLVIYQIKGGGEYSGEQEKLNLFLQIPPAFLQMPEGKNYSVQAKGCIHFLSFTPEYKIAHKEDPGVRGKIKLTIEHFSNFLRHLHQAKIISKVIENLGSIIGNSISKEDLLSDQSERFSNVISIDMTFQSDGIYIGSVKL